MKIYKPSCFQWNGKRTHYFEGWYLKNITKDEKNAFAFIPGISIEKDERHAFVQVFDARNKKSYYIKYDFDEFSFEKNKFDVRIGKNRFSEQGVELDIDDAVIIKGKLEYSKFIGWPVTLFSPGVMGWYAYVPTMECYHGVLGFNHNISGTLSVDGKEVDFTGGKGYCEKDWGVSMPNSWIWMQSNHFENEGTSFFASIAKIPWKNHYFTGFLAGLYHEGKIHRFATYTGAKVSELSVNGNHVKYVIGDKSKKLIITGDRAEGVTLVAPNFGEMSTKIKETLSSKVSIQFVVNDKIIYEGNGRNAGLEFVGDIDELISGL